MFQEIQEILQRNKLYSGQIDGKIGLETLRGLNNMPTHVAKAIQQLMKDQGVYKGSIDGLFGAATYQSLNSLISAPKITAEILQKIYPGANTKYLQYINAMASEWGLSTKAQMCLFLANILVESNGFNDKDLRENFNYRPETLLKTFPKYFASLADARKTIAQGPEAIANKVYGGRLGNTLSDDGWRFRGGGLIQTTGRSNYSVLGKAIKEDLINFPNKISEPEIATKSAYYYWFSKNCGLFADRMQVRDCRKAINGGFNGLDEVQEYFLKAWNYLL